MAHKTAMPCSGLGEFVAAPRYWTGPRVAMSGTVSTAGILFSCKADMSNHVVQLMSLPPIGDVGLPSPRSLYTNCARGVKWRSDRPRPLSGRGFDPVVRLIADGS